MHRVHACKNRVRAFVHRVRACVHRVRMCMHRQACARACTWKVLMSCITGVNVLMCARRQEREYVRRTCRRAYVCMESYLEDFDELQLAVPLDFETFQLSQRTVEVEHRVSLL